MTAAKHLVTLILLGCVSESLQRCFSYHCPHHATLKECLQGNWLCQHGEYCEVTTHVAHGNSPWVIMNCRPHSTFSDCQSTQSMNDAQCDINKHDQVCHWCCDTQDCLHDLAYGVPAHTAPPPSTASPAMTTAPAAMTTAPPASAMTTAPPAAMTTAAPAATTTAPPATVTTAPPATAMTTALPATAMTTAPPATAMTTVPSAVTTASAAMTTASPAATTAPPAVTTPAAMNTAAPPAATSAAPVGTTAPHNAPAATTGAPAVTTALCVDVYLGDCAQDFAGRCGEVLVQQLCAASCSAC